MFAIQTVPLMSLLYAETPATFASVHSLSVPILRVRCGINVQ